MSDIISLSINMVLQGENMFIDKKSPIPVYFQLKDIILKKIENGEYSENDMIPSERELGVTLGISRMTVRQALNCLVNEGVLYREKGRGTFVSRTKIVQKNIRSFSETVSRRGMVPSTKVMVFKKEKAPENIVAALGLKNGDNVYDLRRLRLANQIPVGIEESFIPERYCPNLEKYDLTASLYKIIKEEYAHAISYVDHVIEAAKPTKEEKSLLGISGNIPVLIATGINFTESDLKLFYERSVYRSDEYKFNLRINVYKDME
jgi:GntR family transcriptional regulator